MFFDLDEKKYIEIKQYPNKELYCDRYRGGRLLWKNPSLEEVVIAVNLLSHYDELYISFLPYGRSDKLFFDGQKEPIMRTILKMFAVYSDKKIFIMDPHANIEIFIEDSLFCEFYMFSCMPDILKYASLYLNKEFVAIFPDETSRKRYGYLINDSCSWIEFTKERDKNGKIVSQKISASNFEFGTYDKYLMIDDICSFGGTFLGAMNLFPSGEFYLACAHCEDNIVNGKFIHDNRLKKVFTSNSIFSLSLPKVGVVYECERKI